MTFFFFEVINIHALQGSFDATLLCHFRRFQIICFAWSNQNFVIVIAFKSEFHTLQQ